MVFHTPLGAAKVKQLRSLIKEFELGEFRDQILATARSTVVLVGEFAGGSDETLGASRLGGWPDLPPSVSWPSYKEDSYLSFFAQINLSEIPDLGALPKTGMLYFFIGEYPWNYFQVAYSPNTDNLARTQAPGDQSWIQGLHETRGIEPYRSEPNPSGLGVYLLNPRDMPAVEACRLSTRVEISLPNDWQLEKLGVDCLGHEGYCSLLRHLDKEFFDRSRVSRPQDRGAVGKLFGYGRGIDCADDFAAMELFPDRCWDYDWRRDRAAQIHEESKHWSVLAEFMECEECSYRWYNDGHWLQFGIRDDSVDSATFDRVLVTSNT